MIKLGQTVDLNFGFEAWSGTCMKLELLKWKGMVRQYVVFGTIYKEDGKVSGCSPVFEGTLAECRNYLNKKVQEDVNKF
jgi:hypothetical protein